MMAKYLILIALLIVSTDAADVTTDSIAKQIGAAGVKLAADPVAKKTAITATAKAAGDKNSVVTLQQEVPGEVKVDDTTDLDKVRNAINNVVGDKVTAINAINNKVTTVVTGDKSAVGNAIKTPEPSNSVTPSAKQFSDTPLEQTLDKTKGGVGATDPETFCDQLTTKWDADKNKCVATYEGALKACRCARGSNEVGCPETSGADWSFTCQRAQACDNPEASKRRLQALG